MSNDKSAEEIVRGLTEYAEWCDAHEYEVPLCMGDDLMVAADMIKAMTAQLAASQQRERTLLDDIAQDMACGICVHGCVDVYNEPCSSCRGNSSKFEWRGPEAGEGERDERKS